MAKVSKINNGSNEPSELDQYYYYQIWKNRLSWTKHAIPIRVRDQATGLFMEAYVDKPPQIKDIDKQLIEVEIAWLPIFSSQTIYVNPKNIFPTKRILSKMEKTDTLSMEVIPRDVTFDPEEKYKPSKVTEVFKAYPKLYFTIPELESIINNTIPLDFIENKLEPLYSRNCLITNEFIHVFKEKEAIALQKQQDPMEQISSTLIELAECYKDCKKCHLGEKAKRTVLSRLGKINISEIDQIPKKSTIFFIGEAPGMQEEEKNIVFYPKAPAGEVLYKVIQAAKMDYDKCYFTNAVLCRPVSLDLEKQNGTPDVAAIDACNNRLKNELAIVDPKIIVILGSKAYRAFYGKEPKKVLSMIGWQNPEKTIYFVPHPSYITRELSFTQEENKNTIKANYLKHFQEVNNQFISK